MTKRKPSAAQPDNRKRGRRQQLGLPLDAPEKPAVPNRIGWSGIIIPAVVLCAVVVLMAVYLVNRAEPQGTPDRAQVNEAIQAIEHEHRQVALPPLPPERAVPDVFPEPLPPPKTELPPWQRYAVTTAMPGDGRPRVAIVIDDMGLDRRLARMAVDLPPPLTLAYLPYARDLRTQTLAARLRGHELMVHIPMEPENPDSDPGPHALLTGLPAMELSRRLSANLGRFNGYVGVNNHMGSRFTADTEAMAQVLAEVKSRGLLFLDSRTTKESVAAGIAEDLGVPHASRDVFLDNDRDPAAIRNQLDEVERTARRKGTAIAIGHPYPETLKVLASWLPAAKARGMEIVPLTALIKTEKPRLARAED